MRRAGDIRAALHHFRFLDQWRNRMQALYLRGYLAKKRTRRQRERCAELIAGAGSVRRLVPPWLADGAALEQ